MQTETLSTLKINKLSQKQYDRELANGNIDENAIYLTPEDEKILENHLALSNISTVMWSNYRNAYTTPLIIVNNTTHTLNPEFTYPFNLITPNNIYSVDIGTLTLDTTRITSANNKLFYDIETNTIYVTNPSNISGLENMLYLGGVYESLEGCCNIIPVERNGCFLFNSSNLNGRISSDLLIRYRDNLGGVPILDFTERSLKIRNVNAMWAINSNSFTQIGSIGENGSGTDYTIPIGDTHEYFYLVGNKNSLKFVSHSNFYVNYNQYKTEQYYYFGWVHPVYQRYNFNFPVSVGKTYSVLGDSISTYTGYVPEGNAIYYTGSNCGVNNVNQTWWKQIEHKLGLILNKNNSWAGSKVTGNETSSATIRATQLDNGSHPDIIFLYMGINDFNSNVPIDTFKEAYTLTIKNILSKYKQSKLYTFTLLPCQRNDIVVGEPEYNANKCYLTEFNSAIREISDIYGVEVIDIASCGLTMFNADIYMGDYTESGAFLHPNAEGHKIISEKIFKTLN